MTELFTEVIAVLKADSSTALLSEEFGVASPEAAGNAATLSVPIVILNLGRWANDLTMSYRLFELIRSYDPEAIADPRALLEAGLYNSHNNDLINDLFEERRQVVGDRLAAEAGVNKQSSQGILAASAGLVLASIARRHGSDIGRVQLLSVLEHERVSLVSAGWQPWLDSVDGAVDGAVDSEPTDRAPSPTSRVPPLRTDLQAPPPGAPFDAVPAIGSIQGTDGSAALTRGADYGAGTATSAGGWRGRDELGRVPSRPKPTNPKENPVNESKSMALRVFVVFLAALAIGLGCYLLLNEDEPATGAGLELSYARAIP